MNDNDDYDVKCDVDVEWKGNFILTCSKKKVCVTHTHTHKIHEMTVIMAAGTH